MGRRSDNIVLTKSMDFAIRIVNLYKFLQFEKQEYVMSKQLLRSGTSIGANLHEAEEAISHKEFTSKVYIALKETRETEYWLNLLHLTDYLTPIQFRSLIDDCNELLCLLVSITKTLRSKKE